MRGGGWSVFDQPFLFVLETEVKKDRAQAEFGA
jgi:hypothetical protein